MPWEGSDGGRSPFYFTVEVGGGVCVGGVIGMDIQELISQNVQYSEYSISQDVCLNAKISQYLSFSMGCEDSYLIEFSQFKFYSHNHLAL